MTQIPNLLNLLSPNHIIVYMLVFTRLTGMIQVAPFFSTLRMPVMTKLWFCAIISFIIYPVVFAKKIYIIPHDLPQFIILLLIEFFIGFLIGYIANLIIEGVRLSGNIISIQTGLSMSQALDPVTGVQSTELSRIYIFLAILIFLGTGADHMLFVTLFNSFHSVPIGIFPAFDGNIVIGVCQVFSSMFKIGFGIALPIFAVLLTSDVLLGMMSKMMPQMNIYMVAIPVKIYIGLFLVVAFLSAVSVFMQGVIKDYINYLGTIFN